MNPDICNTLRYRDALELAGRILSDGEPMQTVDAPEYCEQLSHALVQLASEPGRQLELEELRAANENLRIRVAELEGRIRGMELGYAAAAGREET